RWARPRSRVCNPDSSMAMMDSVHVWFRPFRDELSLRRDDGRAAQNGKTEFRRKFGETDSVRGRPLQSGDPHALRLRGFLLAVTHRWSKGNADQQSFR